MVCVSSPLQACILGNLAEFEVLDHVLLRQLYEILELGATSLAPMATLSPE
jgi:hypothetical protein